MSKKKVTGKVPETKISLDIKINKTQAELWNTIDRELGNSFQRVVNTLKEEWIKIIEQRLAVLVGNFAEELNINLEDYVFNPQRKVFEKKPKQATP